ncbi:MAG: alpha-amylase family protein [Actinomyces sp.]|nr:alpha-amylase family protein [Actinomyces sp.]MDN6795044.1 alpha-amylase family protein [Propionibacterium sp.]
MADHLPTHVRPEWMDHAIWWQLMPLTFTGAPRSLDPGAPVAHRLGRVEAWLDHAVDLGANGLQLGPVFRSATHGYDTLDHFHLDPRLGEDADFDHLIAQCHERGLRVMCDGVFNHVSRHHPLVCEALEQGHDSAAGRFLDFRLADDGQWYPQVFEGHPDLVELNHGNPDVVDLVARVLRHWCDRGVDAWRMDAAYAIPPQFWAEVLPTLRATHPDVLTVGEVIHGDYPALVEASTLDSLTQYELWKAIWSSIESQNLFELDWSLQRHNGFLDSFVPTTFVGNHDVTRVATKVGVPGARVATVILMAVGGMPVVYHGDELAMTGLKEDRPGGDDAVRPEFPARPGPATGEAGAMMDLHRAAIAMRRRHPWLVHARTSAGQLSNTRARWDVTGAAGEEHLVLEVDLEGGSPGARVLEDGCVLVDSRH